MTDKWAEKITHVKFTINITNNPNKCSPKTKSTPPAPTPLTPKPSNRPKTKPSHPLSEKSKSSPSHCQEKSRIYKTSATRFMKLLAESFKKYTPKYANLHSAKAWISSFTAPLKLVYGTRTVTLTFF